MTGLDPDCLARLRFSRSVASSLYSTTSTHQPQSRLITDKAISHKVFLHLIERNGKKETNTQRERPVLCNDGVIFAAGSEQASHRVDDLLEGRKEGRNRGKTGSRRSADWLTQYYISSTPEKGVSPLQEHVCVCACKGRCA